jgi:fido (protein-threonine AMPylation protein)
VYEWAGELRDTDLTGDSSYFANHLHFVGAARPVFEKLAEQGCLNGLDAAALKGQSP